jgi:hypothetical protein
VAVPRERPAAVLDRRVRRAGAAGPCERLLAREEVAALDLEHGVEHGDQIRARQREIEPGIARAPARGAARREAATVVLERDDDLLEGERVVDAVRDGVEDVALAAERGQARGDLEQLGEGRAQARRGSRHLRVLERARDVERERREHRDLRVLGPAAGLGLVDGEDPEHVPVGVHERDDEGVVRAPRVRRVDARELGHVRERVLPVLLLLADQVGAVAQEALVEVRRPGVPRSRLAKQLRARGLAAVHGDDLEVVLGRAVEVDHDGVEAERLGDRPGDLVEEPRELAARANEPRDVEEATQVREGVQRGVHGRPVRHRLRRTPIERSRYVTSSRRGFGR